jgi:uncharacterized membrane protein
MVGVFARYIFIPLIGKIIFSIIINHNLSSFYYSFRELSDNISKNVIYSLIIVIIGVILFAILAAGSIASIFMGGQSFGAKSAFGVMVFVGFFVLWLSFVLSGFFSKKYLDIFYEYTKDDLFKYAGLGVLGGTILFVILSIIGWMIASVAFFRMPDSLESNQS